MLKPCRLSLHGAGDGTNPYLKWEFDDVDWDDPSGAQSQGDLCKPLSLIYCVETNLCSLDFRVLVCATICVRETG